jgi:hypothetical protein
MDDSLPGRVDSLTARVSDAGTPMSEHALGSAKNCDPVVGGISFPSPRRAHPRTC